MFQSTRTNHLVVVLVLTTTIILSFLVPQTDTSVTGLGLLAPLLPVAHITGHAGLWAHGLTGAALLKLKAAGALAGLFLLSGRGIEFNVGNEELSNGWGWGGEEDWYKRRGKRDVSDAAVRRLDNVDESFPSLDNVLAYDQLGCGLRFVCELAATPMSQLGFDEKLILELFGRDDKHTLSFPHSPSNPLKASKGKLSYTYASLLGSYAKEGTRACGRVYGQCPYSRAQIIQVLRGVQQHQSQQQIPRT